MMKKKRLVVTTTIAIILLLSCFSLLFLLYKNNASQESLNKKLDSKKTEIKKNTKNKNVSSSEKNKHDFEIENNDGTIETNINSENDKNINTQNVISNPTSSSSNHISQPPIENNSITENSTPAPSCISKKFDMAWVRADFDTFSDCTQLGERYKQIGYGYFCDNYQDDCGITYYMLTLYERNTGIEHDYHTIPLS